MPISGPRQVLGNLIDIERGLISREIFVSDDLYQQQLERIFARAWLFVGHESQIPNPNDFFVSRMGEESVILTRDRQGEVHVLLNTCMHRGMKVCRYDEGNTPVFSCPYHGWSYSTDGNLVSVPGELIGVPQFATAYHGELAKESWGLVHVPQMYNHHGTIWATWDKDAPPFLEYMGGMIKLFDGAITASDGTIGGMEVVGGVQKFIIPSSWMYGAENFIGDGYHGISHRSVDLAAISPQGEGRFPRRASNGQSFQSLCFPRLGHGGFAVLKEAAGAVYAETWPDNPEAEAYFREAHAQRQAKLRAGKEVWSVIVSTTFPNTSTHSGPRSIFVWHPRGPDTMELWRWFIVDKAAPQSVKEELKRYAMRYSGPAGMTEQDDAENWNYATAASHGVIAGRYSFNYTMGLGHARPVPGLEGAVFTDTTGENNALSLYRRWGEFMDATSWDQIIPVGTST